MAMNNFRDVSKQSQMNQQQMAEEANNFYKLHYPNKNSPQAISKLSNKMRSKSVVSVLQSPPNEQYNLYSPKGSIRKLAASKQIYPYNPIPQQAVVNKSRQNSIQKPKQNLLFKTVLSARTNSKDFNAISFPINNLKDVEQLAKKNANVRTILQRAKDQKIKMNKIVMSHKQDQQVKIEYLKNKRDEVENTINEEIQAIYQQYFKSQYQNKYGVDDGEDMFQTKLAQLVATLNRKIFTNK